MHTCMLAHLDIWKTARTKILIDYNSAVVIWFCPYNQTHAMFVSMINSQMINSTLTTLWYRIHIDGNVMHWCRWNAYDCQFGAWVTPTFEHQSSLVIVSFNIVCLIHLWHTFNVLVSTRHCKDLTYCTSMHAYTHRKKDKRLRRTARPTHKPARHYWVERTQIQRACLWARYSAEILSNPARFRSGKVASVSNIVSSTIWVAFAWVFVGSSGRSCMRISSGMRLRACET